MHTNKKQIVLIFIVLYLALALPLFFTIFALPNDLAYHLGTTKNEILDLTGPNFLKLGILLGSQFIIGAVGYFIVFKYVGKLDDREEKVLDLELEDVLEINNLDANNETEVSASQELNLEAILESTSKITAKEAGGINQYCNSVVSHLANEFQFSQGAFYSASSDDKGAFLRLTGAFAFYTSEVKELKFYFGEGLAGQVAKSQKIMLIDDIPEGYMQIISGLGQASPRTLLIFPIVHKTDTIGVLEFSSFKKVKVNEQEINSIAKAISKELRSYKDTENKE